MALFHSSVIVNTGATQDSRARDTLNFPFIARPQVMTIYVRFVELGTVQVGGGGTARLLHIGASSLATPLITIETTPTVYRIRHHNGVGSVTSSLGVAPSFGALVEIRGVLNANGSVLIGQSIAGAAETAGATSAALVLATAWSDTKVWVNTISAAANTGFNAFRNIEIMAGVQTMQAMRVRAGTD